LGATWFVGGVILVAGASRNGVGVGVEVTGVLLGVIAVLVLGLPLLALGLDRVLPQLKGRPVAEDAVQVLARRHHLVPRDVIEVQAAVAEGRAVRPPRLAAAVIDHASHVAGLDMWGRPRGEKRRLSARTRLGLLLVWVAVLVGYVVAGIVSGDAHATGLGAVYLVSACLLGPVQLSGWRRRTAAATAAVAANTGVTTGTPSGDLQ
jgi:hypothetical protein